MDIQNQMKQQLNNTAVKMGWSKPKTSKAPKINNKNLLADTGLRIVHINNRENGGRSMTIAFTGTKKLVEVATSVVHPNDVFCRKVGTKTAVESFQAGRTIRVPVPEMWQGHLAGFVSTLFGGMM